MDFCRNFSRDMFKLFPKLCFSFYSRNSFFKLFNDSLKTLLGNLWKISLRLPSAMPLRISSKISSKVYLGSFPWIPFETYSGIISEIHLRCNFDKPPEGIRVCSGMNNFLQASRSLTFELGPWLVHFRIEKLVRRLSQKLFYLGLFFYFSETLRCISRRTPTAISKGISKGVLLNIS